MDVGVPCRGSRALGTPDREWRSPWWTYSYRFNHSTHVAVCLIHSKGEHSRVGTKLVWGRGLDSCVLFPSLLHRGVGTVRPLTLVVGGIVYRGT